MLRKNQVKEELHNCLELLTNRQLKELYNDPDFMNEAINIIVKRKIDKSN